MVFFVRRDGLLTLSRLLQNHRIHLLFLGRRGVTNEFRERRRGNDRAFLLEREDCFDDLYERTPFHPQPFQNATGRRQFTAPDAAILNYAPRGFRLRSCGLLPVLLLSTFSLTLRTVCVELTEDRSGNLDVFDEVDAGNGDLLHRAHCRNFSLGGNLG